MPTPVNSRSSINGFSTIGKTGLIAGSLDITAACLQYYIRTGNGPGNVLRYVASGVFGRKAFTGGIPMACWGLFFHYLIAFGFTLFFFLIYPATRLVSKSTVITGMLYGVFAWAVMNLLVIPMSYIKPKPVFDAGKGLAAMLILMFCIGLPISILISRYYAKKNMGGLFSK